MTTDQFYETLLDEIAIPLTAMTKARTKRDEVGAIVAAEVRKRLGTTVRVVAVGALAQGTQIAPLNDFDLVIEVGKLKEAWLEEPADRAKRGALVDRAVNQGDARDERARAQDHLPRLRVHRGHRDRPKAGERLADLALPRQRAALLDPHRPGDAQAAGTRPEQEARLERVHAPDPHPQVAERVLADSPRTRQEAAVELPHDCARPAAPDDERLARRVDAVLPRRTRRSSSCSRSPTPQALASRSRRAIRCSSRT